MSDNIPFYIQVEIIKHVLPVKSLIRFTSVSKQWKSLIESSEFITDHSVKYQTQPHHLLVMNELESEYQFFSIVDDDSFPRHKFSPYVPPTVKLVTDTFMLDCSYGLVCLYGSHPYLENNMIVLWNPSIRKSVSILLSLVSSTVGFGVCRKTSDPKIVKMTRTTSSMDWQAEVFTLNSGAWRSVPVMNLPRSLNVFKYRADQVVADGVIYWRAQDFITQKTNRIISFDLTSEEFGEVRLPDCLGNPEYLSISKIKESLVVVTYKEEDELARPICDVWMMKKNGDVKSLLTNIHISSKESHGSVSYEIVGFRKNGKPIMEHIYHDGCVSSTLKVYDPCSKRISDLGIVDSHLAPFKMTSYSESLLLLNHPDSMIMSAFN